MSPEGQFRRFLTFDKHPSLLQIPLFKGVAMHTGKCLCGNVKLSIPKLDQNFGACHCSMCRNWGGGPLLCADGGTDVAFEGKENITSFSSSEWAERGFCNRCGTHLFYRLKQSSQYFIPIGLIENSGNLKFHHQVFIDEKPENYTFTNSTQNMTGAEVFAKFSS